MSFKIALVSMPWPLANRASIQLGSLKSYLNQTFPDIKVFNLHPFLEVANILGISLYNALAENSWIAECPYGYIANPEIRSRCLDFFQKQTIKKPLLRDISLEDLATKISLLHERSGIWQVIEKADLVGVSICLSQLTSSLFFIKELKKRFPKKPLIVGGSMVADKLGESLLEHVSEIDWVANGEGELPLAEVVHFLKDHRHRQNIGPGLYYRAPGVGVVGGGRRQFSSLEELPIPDYRDYFYSLSTLPNLKNLLPSLPIEASRGCWWHRATIDNPEKACQFCNLNLQWKGYRQKTAVKVAREIETLSRKHTTLKFFFVDNNLPPVGKRELFAKLEKQNRAYEIFLETRATVSRDTLLQMRRAGVNKVQVGIEALSTRLLKKMHKGTTAIENIEVMKNCEELGIRNFSNLLIGFPGSDERDVEETLISLDFTFIYRPLRLVEFWLGYHSPIYFCPQNYGIKKISTHRYYRNILPGYLADQLELMQKDYRGDRVKQQKLWRPVKKKIKEWRKYYHEMKNRFSDLPLLRFRDGKEFLIISRSLMNGNETESFRLRGNSRALYRFCEQRKRLGEIYEQFPKLSENTLRNFLHDLVNKKVIFREGDQYLSLAVNVDSKRLDAK